MLTLTEVGWGADSPAYRQLFTNIYVPEATPKQMGWFNEMQRLSASPENAVRLQRVLAAIDARAEEIVAFASELIQQPSVNPDLEANELAEKPAQDWLRDQLLGSGAFDTVDSWEVAANRPNVVATRKGAGDGRSLTWSAHTDVVPVTPEQAEKLVLAANEGKLQLVMRNYVDQEDTQTKGANKGSLLSGDSYVPQPEPKSEATAQSKPARVSRPVSAKIPTEQRPVALPVSRNSVELIEGVKRRDVELP